MPNPITTTLNHSPWRTPANDGEDKLGLILTRRARAAYQVGVESYRQVPAAPAHNPFPVDLQYFLWGFDAATLAVNVRIVTIVTTGILLSMNATGTV